MNLWPHLLTFLLFLLLSPLILAAFLGLIDQRPLLKPAIRLGIWFVGMGIYLLATDISLLLSIGAAFASVVVAHVISGWAFRNLALGVSEIPARRRGAGSKPEKGSPR